VAEPAPTTDTPLFEFRGETRTHLETQIAANAPAFDEPAKNSPWTQEPMRISLMDIAAWGKLSPAESPCNAVSLTQISHSSVLSSNDEDLIHMAHP
jgi:hypothetical protein